MAITITTTEYPNGYNQPSEKVTKVIGVDSTLGVYRKTHRVMSDIWEDLPTAQYIDENGALREQIVSSYGQSAEVTVDVSEDAWKRHWNYVFSNHRADLRIARENDAVRIQKGDMVKVVSGRTEKGAMGKVVVIMDGHYGMGYRAVPMKKYGIAISDRMVEVERNGRIYSNHADMIWVWSKNIEAITLREVDETGLDEAATKKADSALAHQRKTYQTRNLI